jgi:hypothetical protein
VELRRSGQTVRLRGEVVRSFVIRSEGSSGTLRYRTALRFPETPREIFGLLPELVEDSKRNCSRPSIPRGPHGFPGDEPSQGPQNSDARHDE